MENIKEKIKKARNESVVWVIIAGITYVFFICGYFAESTFGMMLAGIPTVVSFFAAIIYDIRSDFLRDKVEEKEQKAEALNSEEFYNLMQEYRHAPLENQYLTSEKFANIKKWLSNNL